MAPSTTLFPSPHVINPKSHHTHTIILLHGRNSNGEEFAEELLEGAISSGAFFGSHDAFSGCKWIFPTSSSSWSAQFQEDLTEWFDLASTSNPYAEADRQVRGLRESVAYIDGIVDEEMKTLPANRIILGGMSQGFATAIHVLLSRQTRLAGFIGLSGWLPFYPEIFPLTQQPYEDVDMHLTRFYGEHLNMRVSTCKAGTATPMIITHSQDDDVIDIQLGRDACSVLRALGSAVTLKEYTEGGHEVYEPYGYDDIQQFLTTIISN